jgi:hypothetical protein
VASRHAARRHPGPFYGAEYHYLGRLKFDRGQRADLRSPASAVIVDIDHRGRSNDVPTRAIIHWNDPADDQLL